MLNWQKFLFLQMEKKMKNMFKCPLCGETEKCKKRVTDANGYQRFHCEKYHADYYVADDILNLENDIKEQCYNLIAEDLLRKSAKHVRQKVVCKYDYRESEVIELLDNISHVNVADKMKGYPRRAIECAERALLNLSFRYPHYGDIICPMYQDRRYLFEHESNNNGSFGVLELLCDLGYVKDVDGKQTYVIAAEGWKKIDVLINEEYTIKQAFIAMSFGAETKEIREAFRTAIRSCGYIVRVIDEKEHNNQIVPEILYEISRSKFVVVDITYPNYGAYYEAGYAQALGKEVIVCCHASRFASDDKNQRPHFDIAQKSMIVWQDEEELINRLKRRIEATVK